MNDPLDDIDAILTSICNNDNPHDDYHFDSHHDDIHPKDDNDHQQFASPTQDLSSPQASRLDNLLHHLQGDSTDSPTPPLHNSRLLSSPKKPQRTKALKSKSKSSSPKRTGKIKKPRKTKKTPSKNPPKKAPLLSHPHSPPHNVSRPITDDEVKIGTSADEAESNRFIQQMRLLAEEKLQAEKRKAEASKQKTIKRMQNLSAQREADMRRVAGVASKGISKGIAAHKKSVPKDIGDTMAEIKKTLADEAKEKPSVVQDLNKMGCVLQKLESDVQSQRVHAFQLSHAKEQKLLQESARLSAKSKEFTKVLLNVEGDLKLGRRGSA